MTWLEEAKKAIRESSHESSVYVGSDSLVFKKNGKKFARYSTVIIVHKDSKHGCMLFHHNETLPEFGNLKQRLMTEVQYAVEIATELLDVIGNRHMEVHLDLNSSPNHKSNIAVKEALGWVKGSLGIDGVIKPDSFAATHCADHLVRNKHSYVH